MAQSFLDQAGLPRGLRNNNPGDLRAGDDWKGETGVDQDGFIIFQDIAWGVRAMGTVIVNDIAKGLDTIRKLITHYAPPSENPTARYIASVAADTGLDPDQVIPLDLDTLASLIRGMINFELGVDYSRLVTDADINTGVQLMNSTLLALFTQAKQNPAVSIAVLLLLVALAYGLYKGFRK